MFGGLSPPKGYSPSGLSGSKKRRNFLRTSGGMEKEAEGGRGTLMREGESDGDEEEGFPLMARNDSSSSRGNVGMQVFVIRQLKGWFTWPLLVDWAILVLLLIIDVPISLNSNPYERYLPASDPSVTYPMYEDTVPTWAVGLLMLLPFSIFVMYQVLQRSAHDLHNACLGLATALVLTLVFTDAVKLSAGRYRPDWLARQTESSAAIKDGRQSFPSGHSSISFAGMVFLSLYLAGKTGVFRRNGGALWKVVVMLLPIASATAVAVSRTRDYHHHFSDILAGSILGTGIAFLAYHLNYHPLNSTTSHLPKLRKGEKLVYCDPPDKRKGEHVEL